MVAFTNMWVGNLELLVPLKAFSNQTHAYWGNLSKPVAPFRIDGRVNNLNPKLIKLLRPKEVTRNAEQ
jgi:hypothetical protein